MKTFYSLEIEILKPKILSLDLVELNLLDPVDSIYCGSFARFPDQIPCSSDCSYVAALIQLTYFALSI